MAWDPRVRTPNDKVGSDDLVNESRSQAESTGGSAYRPVSCKSSKSDLHVTTLAKIKGYILSLALYII